MINLPNAHVCLRLSDRCLTLAIGALVTVGMLGNGPTSVYVIFTLFYLRSFSLLISKDDESQSLYIGISMFTLVYTHLPHQFHQGN